ncbi:hypothetical protein [Labedaea rhizosphaerae]|uniref:Uncharacterized protein n=1 Tax=Labedaea rhizosphaerae TaxID=598644 RepID=A0A4R6S643_LABRH|nr:hypothetical protein [Labedaea rhizosphaerae]TDP94813.1 hypothetical protein EV186_10545 [Labedaea rhizosphaerae]
MTIAATAFEVSATTSALGVIGLLSMLVLRVALKVCDAENFDHLPVALAARVRWWDRHHPALLAASACLLAGGVVGLVLD